MCFFYSGEGHCPYCPHPALAAPVCLPSPPGSPNKTQTPNLIHSSGKMPLPFFSIIFTFSLLRCLPSFYLFIYFFIVLKFQNIMLKFRVSSKGEKKFNVGIIFNRAFKIIATKSDGIS